MRPRTILVAVLGLLVSAAAFVGAFWQVHFSGGFVLTPRVHLDELGAALAGVHGGWLLVFAALNVTTLGLRALQLQALVRRRDGSAPRLHGCYQAVAVAMMAQNVLPARLGEAARVVALARAEDVRPTAATGAVVFGRVLDLAAVLAITCLPFVILPGRLPVVGARTMHVVAVVGSLVAALLVALLVVVYRRREWLVARAERVRPWLARGVAGFVEGLSALGDRRRLLEATLATLAIPVTLAFTYGAALLAFGLGDLPAGSALVLTAVVLFAIAVPSAPSSLGVFHAAATWTLTSLGAAPGPAAAFALVVHAVGVVGFVTLGAVALAQLGGRALLRQA
jgi:glycosyltransferase 2 family protein